MPEELLERIFFITVVIVLLIMIVKYKWDDIKKKRDLKKRFERGGLLEVQAREFLENKNYKIIGVGKSYVHNYLVNGVPHQSKLILDYIVKKKGKTYIVEVKSGVSAIHLKNSSTRRQILEYDFVIENDGVFILDMENKKMQLVEFQSKKVYKHQKLLTYITIISILAIAIPFWQLKLFFILLVLFVWKFPNKTIKLLSVFYRSS